MKDSAQHASLAAAAYSVVRQRILRGDITLGQVISRRKLAAELNMSFLPVSEALLRLEFEGLLESRPRAGTRVRIPSPDDVKGTYVVREALEVQAAVLFTQAATADEHAELQDLAQRVDALAVQSDRALYVREHQRLHARIAECARCDALLEAIEKTHALASIWVCVMRQPQPGESTTRHQDLVAALCSGDPARAAAAVREHIAVGMEHSLEVLQPYFQLRTATGRTFYRSNRKLRQRALN
jgi:DNA-binding GntR family transcriptional regulator